MNKAKVIVPLIIIASLLFCITSYLILPKEIKWIISSVIDVPACMSIVGDKLGVQPEIGVVKENIIKSLQLGMTSDEVGKTLGEIAPIAIINNFVDNEQGIHQEILIKLCDNPLGNVLLFVYYSKEGYLINIGDAHAD